MRIILIAGLFTFGLLLTGCGDDPTDNDPLPIRMVRIPAGTFTMGSPANEIGRPDTDSESQWQVTLSAFFMGVYQITQEQWAIVMEGNTNGISPNPSHFLANPVKGEVQRRRPVEVVNWYDTLVFTNRLSMIEGLSPAYSVGGSTDPDDWGTVPKIDNATWNAVTIAAGSTGYRLPTEAQWEYACRAGTTTAFNLGIDNWENETALNPIGWFNFNSDSRTHEVGKKAPNTWGLYDMHGNVSEWCWDLEGTYPIEAQTNPTGASSGSFRVLRGGTFSYTGRIARSANRDRDLPHFRSTAIGLRLVRP